MLKKMLKDGWIATLAIVTGVALTLIIAQFSTMR